MFTDKQIANLQPGAKPYREYERGADRGFHVQVLPSGRKVWALAYTYGGRARFMRLGAYPDTTLKAARDACRAARALLDRGIDPQDERASQAAERAVQARRERMQGTVTELCGAYLATLEGRSSREVVRRSIGRDVLPALGKLKAASVTPQDVALLLGGIIERGSPIQANRVRSYISAAFRFGIGHDLHPANISGGVLFGITANPARDVPRPVKREAVGDRELSPDEIAHLWRALPARCEPQIVAAIRLMLATGQRAGEVLGARWGELDADQWNIPATRAKNGRSHIVPLNDVALDVLAELRPITGGGALLCPNERDASKPQPLTSLSRAINRFCERTGAVKFTPRDLRRTFKTRTGELGLSKDIRDRIQNHAMSDVSARHYDRYDYLPEKRRALDAWGEYLRRIIAGAAITPIKRVSA
jgi:integrase